MKNVNRGISRATGTLLLILLITTALESTFGPNEVSGAPSDRGNDWNDLILTNEERYKLIVFKERVIDKLPDDYMKTDFYLIRWLRKKNLSIDEAIDMLMENVHWRQENKIKDILWENFSDISEDYRISPTTDTHDKKDRPVGSINLGSWDVRLAVIQGKFPRLTRCIDRFMESLVQQIFEAQTAGKEVTRAVVLVDLDGFNIFQHMCPSCISIVTRLLHGVQSHYPSFWEEIILINAPSTFGVFLHAVEGALPPQFRTLIKVFDTNKSHWMPYLDEKIERDQRYLNYGGTKIPRDN